MSAERCPNVPCEYDFLKESRACHHASDGDDGVLVGLCGTRVSDSRGVTKECECDS